MITLSEKQMPAGFFQSHEVHSPSNWIDSKQIKVYEDKVVVDIKNATWARFTNTNSMDPLIDEHSHAIEILPEDPHTIDVGDVISYRTTYGTVIHRVIERGQDQEGLYYIVKGDNNQFTDPFKVRYDAIEGVVVAVIY